MWPLATGERDSLRDWSLTVWAYEASVRDHTWNAVVNIQESDPQWKLYRVDADRDNFDDVAAQHPDVVELQRAGWKASSANPYRPASPANIQAAPTL